MRDGYCAHASQTVRRGRVTRGNTQQLCFWSADLVQAGFQSRYSIRTHRPLALLPGVTVVARFAVPPT